MSYLTAALLVASIVISSCSGNGNKDQSGDTTNLLPQAPATQENTEKPVVDFGFDVDGKPYKMNAEGMSYYVAESDTSSLLYVQGDLKKDSSETIINIMLRIPKDALKPGDYAIVDGNDDNIHGPCKITYTPEQKNGKADMGYSNKGVLTVADYKETGKDQGSISGNFSFDGTALVFDDKGEPTKKATKVKGRFKDVKLLVNKSGSATAK